MVSVSFATPETLPQIWQECRPMILKALTKGAGVHTTEQHYFQAVESGIMQMWVMHDDSGILASGILSIQEHPQSKVLFVELLAGKELEKWLPAVEPLLREYKKQVGATTIEASCRPGFIKKLANWRQKAVLMELL